MNGVAMFTLKIHGQMIMGLHHKKLIKLNFRQRTTFISWQSKIAGRIHMVGKSTAMNNGISTRLIQVAFCLGTMLNGMQKSPIMNLSLG